ncbi:uncharacterized protein C8Q71DRAFT_858745 [Rhodofomes roseus]|uniref:RRM domain-containing protein n=1 Tax=Rhodofomes roseus TaxID=34475 RepID=A0ABQ8KE61_9APHY|nr:uncharacterized protein C8Q71DRAFT_858745 [Rhodofomes roseus]KAH9835912.1 hypothetical protein C8Q71DRAFT_858745 [Rhodofomes roseus]
MSRPAVAHIRRQSSRIEAWLSEQHRIVHTIPDGDLTPTGAKSHPYYAYPHPSAVSMVKQELDGRQTTDSYLVVNDASRLSRNASAASARSPNETPRPSPPSTPRKTSPLRSGQRRFPSPSPLRNFHLSFGGRRPSISSEISAGQGSAPSLASARTKGESSAAHTYTSGLSTSHAPSRSERTDTRSSEHASSWLKSPPTWKFKRPSVMEPVAPVMEGPGDEPPSRPSLSSTVTRSSATSNAGTTSLETPSTQRKLPFGSVHAQSPSVLTGSSPSLWSLPTDASHMNDPPDSMKVIARDRDKTNSIRIPLSLRIPSANTPSFGSVSTAIASPRHKRKRKLIVSGIPRGDEKRYEAVKKWCESFGEVNAISREPNGNLHVDFRKAEVAETVCRLQARVYIKGVGSVCLSYFTGKKP